MASEFTQRMRAQQEALAVQRVAQVANYGDPDKIAPLAAYMPIMDPNYTYDPNFAFDAAQQQATAKRLVDDGPSTLEFLGEAPENGAVIKDEIPSIVDWEKFVRGTLKARQPGLAKTMGLNTINMFQKVVPSLQLDAAQTGYSSSVSDLNNYKKAAEAALAGQPIRPDMFDLPPGGRVKKNAFDALKRFYEATPEERQAIIEATSRRVLSNESDMIRSALDLQQLNLEYARNNMFRTQDLSEVRSLYDLFEMGVTQAGPSLAIAAAVVGGTLATGGTAGVGIALAGLSEGALSYGQITSEQVGDITDVSMYSGDERLRARMGAALTGAIGVFAGPTSRVTGLGIRTLASAAARREVYDQISEPVLRRVSQGYLRRVGSPFLRDGIEEFFAEGAQTFIEQWAVKGDDFKFDDETLWAAFNGAVLGGMMGGTFGLGVGARNAIRMERIAKQMRDAGATVQTMEELEAVTRKLKLPVRSPEMFAALSKKLGLDKARVFYQAKAVEDYATATGQKVEDVVAKIGGNVDDFNAALKSGGKLVVRADKLAAALTGTDAEFLKRNGSITPQGFSAREAEAFAQKKVEIEAQALSQAGHESMGASRKSIFDTVQAQIRNAGRTEQEAREGAILATAFFETMGARYGADPADMFRRFGFDVTGEADMRKAQAQALSDARGQLIEGRDNVTALTKRVADLEASLEKLTGVEKADAQRDLEAAQDALEEAQALVEDIERILTDSGTTLRQDAPREVRTQMDRDGNTPDRIPTAQPWTARATKDMDMGDNSRVIGLDAMKANPQAFAFNMDVLKNSGLYPGFVTEATDPDQIAEDFVQFVMGNLRWLYDQVPAQIRNRSRKWYDGARAITERWAVDYNIEDYKVAAVLAALSPQKDWYQNVSLAERVLDIYFNYTTGNGRAFVATPEMAETAARIYGKEQYADDVAVVTSSTLSDLTEPHHKAMWLRIYDETYNPRGYRTVSSEGQFLGEPSGNVAWGSNVEIAKAIKSLEATSLAVVSAEMGTKHKVRNFYNNILAPNATFGDVTIDTHAVAASLLRPLSGNSPEVHHNFGSSPAKSKQPKGWVAMKNIGDSGSHGSYGIYAEAHRRLAAELGIHARELQSITWEAIRGVFSPEQKRSKAFLDRVNGVWSGVTPTSDLTAVREKVVNDIAGGINDPTWFSGPDSELAQSQVDASYAGELADVRVRRRPAGQLVAGDRGPAGTGGGAGGVSFDQSAIGGTGGVNDPQGIRRAPTGRENIRGRVVESLGVFGSEERPIVELANPADFRDAIAQAKQELGELGAQVTLYDDYAGKRVFIMDDGLSGFALDGDDIISVFGTTDAPPGAVKEMFPVATALGGRRLDAFNTFLPKVYERAGFRAVARLGFSREFAPPDWDYDYYQREFGNSDPDIMFMVYDPANANRDTDNVVAEYDDGMAAQQQALVQAQLVTGAGPETAADVGFENSEVQQRVFHRTPKEFDDFQLGGDRSGQAIWFSMDRASLPSGRPREGDRVIEAFVNLENPLMLDEFNLKEMQERWANGSKEFPFYLTDETRQRLIEAGFDGVISEDVYGDGTVNELFVLDPSQVQQVQPEGRTFDQPAFQATGAPDFDEFNLDFMGSGSGGADLGVGFYFGTLDTANAYRTLVGGRSRVLQADLPENNELINGDVAIASLPDDILDALDQVVEALGIDFETLTTDPETRVFMDLQAELIRKHGDERAVLQAFADNNLPGIRYSSGTIVMMDPTRIRIDAQAVGRDGQVVRGGPVDPNAIKDENGEPVTLYHGTNKEFTDFKDGMIFFSSRRGLAVEHATREGSQGARLITANVALENPLEISSGDADPDTYWLQNAQRLESTMQAGEHDGLIVRNNAGELMVIATSNSQVRRTPEPQRKGTGVFRQDKRGQIFFPGGRVMQGRSIITLFQKADKSTFVHEAGHFFLQAFTELASLDSAPPDMRADLQVINEFLGRDADDLSPDFTVEQQEKWAVSFEKYIETGKAPSIKLRTSFERFRKWIMGVYRSVGGLQAELTPEITEVMDRMLATDDQIAIAKAQQDMAPMLVTRPAGMPDDEWLAYKTLAAEHDAEAHATLLGKVMKKIRDQRRKDYKARVDALNAEVTAEVDNSPEQRTVRRLLDPDRPRLNKAQLVKVFGDDVLADLDRHATNRKLYGTDGQDIEQVARQLGYRNAATLIDQLRELPGRKERVETEMRTRLQQEFGDFLDEGKIEEAAMAALYGEKHRQLRSAELRILDAAIRQNGGTPPQSRTVEEMKREAEDTIASMSLAQAGNPATFLQAERRAAREAERLWARIAKRAAGSRMKGNVLDDLVKARAAKERQLQNHLLYNESLKVKDEAVRLLKKGREVSKAKMAERIDDPHLSALRELLGRFDFRQMSKREQQRRVSMAAYVAAMQTTGVQPDGTQGLGLGHLLAFDADSFAATGQPMPYQQMRVEQMREVAAAAKNIEHIGRIARKERLGDREFDHRLKVQDIVATLEDRFKDDPASKVGNRRGAAKRVLRNIRGWFLLSTNMDGIFQQLGGGGPGVINTISQAYQSVFDGTNRSLARQAQNLDWFAKDWFKETGVSTARQRQLADMAVQVRFRDGTSETVDGYKLIAIAANTGNADNYERMTNEDSANSITPEEVQRLMDEHMTEDMWRLTAALWSKIDSFWPEIVAHELREKGVAPEKVQAQLQITGAPSFVKGGYYPIIYNYELSPAREVENELDLKNMQGGRFAVAQTRSGHTKQRSTNTGDPLAFDITGALRHMNNVVHDLELRGPLSNAMRLTKDRAVSETFARKGLDQEWQQIVLWLEDVASGDRSAQDMVSNILRHLRSGTSSAVMAWSVTTLVQQPLGVFNSIDVLGGGAVARGYADYMANPAAVSEMVMQKSAFMRERQRTYQRDVNVAMTNIQLRDKNARAAVRIGDAIRGSGFSLIGATQFFAVDAPTWNAAYTKAIAEGKAEEQAISFADRIVARAQGGGGLADRSALERGTVNERQRQSEWAKASTTFMTFLIQRLAITQARFRDLDLSDPGTMLAFAKHIAMAYILPSIFTQMMVLRLWDEREEEEIKELGIPMWWLKTQLAPELLSGVPGASQIMSAFSGYGSEDLIGGAIGDIARGGMEIGEVLFGDEDFTSSEARAIITSIGILFKLPSTQVNRVVKEAFEDDQLNTEEFNMLEAMFGKELTFTD